VPLEEKKSSNPKEGGASISAKKAGKYNIVQMVRTGGKGEWAVLQRNNRITV